MSVKKGFLNLFVNKKAREIAADFLFFLFFVFFLKVLGFEFRVSCLVGPTTCATPISPESQRNGKQEKQETLPGDFQEYLR
jgi:hypothetical protein